MSVLTRQMRRGPLTMLLGFTFLGLVPVMVKALRAFGWNAAQTVAARFAIACLCIGVLVAVRRRWLVARNRPLLVLRGVLGGAAVLLFFTSVQLAGAGTGTLLNYTYPVWANLIGVVVLRQRTSSAFWLLLAIALLGLVLVIAPKWGEPRLGELAGVCSAILAGAAVVCIKQLRETDDSLTIIWSFSGIGLLFALPLALLDPAGPTASPQWQDAKSWVLLGLTGILSFFGHVFFTHGYKYTTLQMGSILALAVPVIAVLSGWLFLDEPLSPTFLLGGALISVSAASLGVRDSRRGALVTSPRRT